MQENKKILLIYPNYILSQSRLSQLIFKLFAPSNFMHIGLAYLAAVLEKSGFEVYVIDATAERLSLKKLVERIKKIKPTIIGITSNIAIASTALRTLITCRLHFKDTKLVIGGPWATINWKYVLKNSYADFVVIGEGEKTIVDLVQTIYKVGDYKTVLGIAFKNSEGKIIKTPDRPFIQELDDLPFPAWHLFPSSKNYNFPLKRTKAYPLLTSRGCPFKCNFCSKFIHGSKMRYRTPISIINEIKFLIKKFDANEIFIIDDNFTLDNKRTVEILDRIIANNFDLSITLSNGVRADTLSRNMLLKMEKAGIEELAIGVESGNQKVLDKVGKSLQLKEVRKISEVIKKIGFFFRCFFIIGHPFDNPVTMMETINFARDLDPDIAQFSKATPWQGTQLYKLIKTKGKFIGSLKKMRSSHLFSSSFEIWDMTPKKMNKYFILAYILFYFRLKKLFSILKRIRTMKQLKWSISNMMMLLGKI